MVTMQEEFYRIKRLPPYVFAEVNALKARARAAGSKCFAIDKEDSDER